MSRLCRADSMRLKQSLLRSGKFSAVVATGEQMPICVRRLLN